MPTHAGSAAPWVDYEWAVVRLVPQVHRGQRVNVGVILHARTAGFLELCLAPPWPLIEALAPALDRALVTRHLEAYRRVCAGDPKGGTVALLPPSERFHWLTAPRSAMLQTSAIHGGRTRDPARALERLVREQCATPD